jgi:hypothetical protein
MAFITEQSHVLEINAIDILAQEVGRKTSQLK